MPVGTLDGVAVSVRLVVHVARSHDGLLGGRKLVLLGRDRSREVVVLLRRDLPQVLERVLAGHGE